ncbi:AraC family transcriptional regulator [Bradyrhizobium jicamae]|uniref:AraC family transcriptional regulator n=1 Tax=Bradyrhizobium jicamae TaxID=280332 RepID=A0ABS5FWY9_9BRAD|nr:AraC family transcriptional regulator [Bradyrhizobium jicamae]MBR0801363.1 AraC family transcriptional regulator [Bradyrhizobium jicamae]MBR0937341.1 AraC family transcriptional regulator [Bradyrhizobium jicamae]
MDVLSDVLETVRLTGAIFFERHLHAPWVGESPPSAAIASMVMPNAQHVISFHAILSGSCWAGLADSSTSSMRFKAGDIVIYPMGDANVLSSAPGMRGLPDLQDYARPKDRPLPIVTRLDNDSGDYCHLVCGYFGCDARPFNPLLQALPSMLLSQMSATAQSWLSNMLRLAAEEAGRSSAGSESLLARLAELMFVEVVRQYIANLPDDSKGWLSGLKHRHVGQALQLIHGRPGKPWTLAELAREVGLSRSVLADRFTHYVGVSPMHYLGRWRMQLAIRHLTTPGVSVAQVGAEVGYESEAAFNRAFKKYVGVPPGSWRRGKSSRVPE